MSSKTIDRILESAENQARTGGYNAFSFREIAKEIGIKSASIHYHFPTKADLAAELANRYTQKFAHYLATINEEQDSLAGGLNAYMNLFQQALITDKKMCLCGLFAAEVDVLPDNVKEATREFFQAHIHWLTQLFEQYNADEPEDKAIQLLANLEGALLIAKAMGSESYFTRAIDLSPYHTHTTPINSIQAGAGIG